LLRRCRGTFNSSQWPLLAVSQQLALITAEGLESAALCEFMCLRSERQLYRSRKTHPRLVSAARRDKRVGRRDIEQLCPDSLIE